MTTIYGKRMEATALAENTVEVSLPDYCPEVRRVVGVQAAATVDGKYLAGDALEVDGDVTYTILYTSAEGGLAHYTETASYTGRIPMKADDGRVTASDVVLSATADGVSCRVTSPRRLTLSSKVRLTGLAQKPMDAGLDAPSTARRRETTITTAAMTEVQQSGEVAGELREREGMTLLFATGGLCLHDARLSGDGRLTVQGEAYLTALLRTPEGVYVTARSRAPMEEALVLPDAVASRATYPTAFGRIVSMEIEGGDDGVFAWRMEYDMDGVLMGCAEAALTADAYLPDCVDEAETTSFAVTTPASAFNGRLTMTATTKLRPDCAFVCAWGTGAAERADILDGHTRLSGAVRLSVVTVGGGEFFLDEVVIPLKYSGDAIVGAGDSDALSGRVQVDVTDITARAEGDVLNLTAELAVTAALLAEENHTAVTALTKAGDAAERRKNVLRVYIPDRGEEAWDVEKRFRLVSAAQREGDVYVI